MTRQEVCKRYNIPVSILCEDEKWRMKSADKRAAEELKYRDDDLKQLGTIMTLRSLEFTKTEAESYIELSLERQESSMVKVRMIEEKQCTDQR